MIVNRVNIMGNLTKDPEVKKTPSGRLVSNFSIAHNHTYFKNKIKVTKVSYFDVEFWGNSVAIKSEFLSKGKGVVVEGRLIQDRWEKEGKSQSRIKIIADTIGYLSKKDEQETQAPKNPCEELVANVCEELSFE